MGSHMATQAGRGKGITRRTPRVKRGPTESWGFYRSQAKPQPGPVRTRSTGFPRIVFEKKWDEV